MKNRGIAGFLALVVIIAFGVYTALSGFSAGGINIAPLGNQVKQGLDLKGGVYVVYEAQTDAKGEELKKIIDQTIEVFRRRIDTLGLTEPVIVKEGEKRIRIELPGVKNANDALEMIGKTAQLKFALQDGTVIVTGKNVKKSEVVIDQQSKEPLVALEFDAEGAKAFADATEQLAPTQSPIFIVLDNEVISSPVVNEKIPNGQATITGNFTVESASELANLIRAGALPVDFKEIQTSTITATLGENALKMSLLGAKVGIAILIVYMMAFYKLPGLVAAVALAAYGLIVGYSFVGMNATLTLPGIAALILSMGMAVDANVIIFERIKEEIGKGKSLRVAIDAGFSRAMTTIIDSNVTTFIAGVVLYNFGTGPIKGFAVMLMLGIVASMFTAVVVSKLLLKTLANAGFLKNNKLFGA
ncbi:protein-export membrane protein SecDF [Peptoclostridium acidaminophilum DSM 3953]|uniref:Protein translocase subunit SecD n=1 Tax=Peptoclostridium acidaminophilum DSM 3953 TaxID=1286171 RepID=W8T5Y3_PEPAC|nr:protein translocase subunit SecD [Peptoclostridium acidaminophilum]AHM56270.1 protein-export membrane protein SecDF [Peptoclostridium acidaminophilum DSM 3953]